MLKVFISGKGWYLCVNMCVCVMNLWVCQNVCAYFSVFQVFCIGYIIFEIEKKKTTHRLKTLLLQVTEFVWSPFPQSLASLHWNALDDSWGNCSLVTIPTSLVSAPPKPFSPTPNYPAKSPSGPTATWPERCRAGPAGRQAERPNAGWAEMVPRASVSISACCRDTTLCCLPPPLGCSADSVTAGLMGPFYTA